MSDRRTSGCSLANAIESSSVRAVDQARQAQLLGDLDEIAGGHDRAIGPGHPQQALVERGLAGTGRYDRLQRKLHPVLVERVDHVVGDGDVAAACVLPGRALLVGLEAVVPFHPGGIERVQRCVGGLLHGRGLGRDQHSANRYRCRQLAGGGADRRFADRLHQALGGNAGGPGIAVREDHPEFVRGVPAEDVTDPQLGLEQVADPRDDLVADVEAETHR